MYIYGCPIITHEPLDKFALNFDWGNQENHGNDLGLVFKFKVERPHFYRGE